MLGLFGCRGFAITENDIAACLEGRPGRFMPDHSEWKWIHGMRAAIDFLEREAEFGRLPGRRDLDELFEQMVGEQIARLGGRYREEQPWDRIEGYGLCDVDQLQDELELLEPDRDFGLEERPPLHPVQQAARVFRRVLWLSPFRDYNLPAAALFVSWILLAQGYPPLLPQAPDRHSLGELVKEPDVIFDEWFSEVLLVGDRALHV